MAFGGVANGLSPISSSMTSLPSPMRRLAMARTLKALSTLTDEANWLNAGIRSRHHIADPRVRIVNLVADSTYCPHELSSSFVLRFSFAPVRIPHRAGHQE